LENEKMPQNTSPSYTVLHLRFKLQVPPDALLSQSRHAAATIASIPGLIWKIWLLQKDRSEIGGLYLFANRESALAYLDHPIVQAVCTNPAVRATDSQLWDVENPLSALTRAPLPELAAQYLEPETLPAGGQ
jgi:hypothetical protein